MQLVKRPLVWRQYTILFGFAINCMPVRHQIPFGDMRSADEKRPRYIAAVLPVVKGARWHQYGTPSYVSSLARSAILLQ